jgi:hypothetical protein
MKRVWRTLMFRTHPLNLGVRGDYHFGVALSHLWTSTAGSAIQQDPDSAVTTASDEIQPFCGRHEFVAKFGMG